MAVSFRGGIRPKNKTLTTNKAFVNLPIPLQCYIPLRQHTGAPARPLVHVGDLVHEGQLIGEASGAFSSNVHASIPGKVIAIREHTTIYNDQLTIIIEAEGAFETSTYLHQSCDWQALSGNDIYQKIRDLGIIGLGGESFPISDKFIINAAHSIDTLIVNGTECEPYFTAEDVLMRSHPDDIIEGTRIVLHALGINNAIIAISDNKKAAIKSINNALKVHSRSFQGKSVQLKKTKTKYPQGFERLLIRSLLNRNIPSAGAAKDVGVVVLNVSTINAIRDGVLYNKPMIERYVTISGSLVRNPGNYKVRIGTRLSDIINECGGLRDDTGMVVFGGSMLGFSVKNMDVPFMKGTTGILFLSKKEVAQTRYTSCIRCGSCISVCPVGLMPYEFDSNVQKRGMDRISGLNPQDCIQCGCCSYVCPAGRPLTYSIKRGIPNIES